MTRRLTNRKLLAGCSWYLEQALSAPIGVCVYSFVPMIPNHARQSRDSRRGEEVSQNMVPVRKRGAGFLT